MRPTRSSAASPAQLELPSRQDHIDSLAEAMRFQATPLQGVMLVTPDRFEDERGFLARTWGCDEFEAHGLQASMVQRNVSYNRARHTLRGMHFQREPHAEIKLVSCIVGAIYDVAIDIRPESPTFGKWFGAELRQDNGVMLYLPRGCAHGYLSLSGDSVVEYLISDFYHPEVAGGIRWDDPFFGVEWPAPPQVINERDATYPDFEPGRYELTAPVGLERDNE